MHLDYAKVMRFGAWLFKEIVNLTNRGTVEELSLLVKELESVKQRYSKGKRRLKSGKISKGGEHSE